MATIPSKPPPKVVITSGRVGAADAKTTVKEELPQKKKEFKALGAFLLKGRRKQLLILLLLCVVGGGAGWYFLNDGQNKKEPSKVATPPPLFLPIEAFVVNLQTDGIEQFLQISFTFVVSSQEDADRIKLYSPKVKSELILLLSGKRAAELQTSDGKAKLADEILALVRKPFTPGAKQQMVSSVLFTSFLIQ